MVRVSKKHQIQNFQQIIKKAVKQLCNKQLYTNRNINSQKEYKKMLKYKKALELKIFYKILKEKLSKYGYLTVIQIIRLVFKKSKGIKK